ncbi:hypothetical protein C7212DRAFT_331963 [Tuber magnatum]|uniref:Uncharacterized protein n=1 Tax=Tuber magnatum TaxID=42249 RepID=A0A317SJ14_9PEZI|nr:hypothetical protein C7212DRAFT_331963 [Tuber magnatum]
MILSATLQMGYRDRIFVEVWGVLPLGAEFKLLMAYTNDLRDCECVLELAGWIFLLVALDIIAFFFFFLFPFPFRAVIG